MEMSERDRERGRKEGCGVRDAERNMYAPAIIVLQDSF